MIYTILLVIYILSEIINIFYRGIFGFLRISQQPLYYRRVVTTIKFLVIGSGLLYLITQLFVGNYLNIVLIICSNILVEVFLYIFCLKKAIKAEMHELVKWAETEKQENPITGGYFTKEEMIEQAPQIVRRAIKSHERVL